jgi:hypothetical protein
MGLLGRPALWLRGVQASRRIAPHILDLEQTLDAMLAEGVSLSRFGDGELKLAFARRGLRFQPVSRELTAALEAALFEPKNGYLACYNTQFMQADEWVWLTAFERYGQKLGTRTTLVTPDDAIVLSRRRQAAEYRRYWKRLSRRTHMKTYGAAGVFFLGLYTEAYQQGRTEEVLDKFRQLFNGRRILFVAPTTPMGGQSFAEQVPLMRRLGLKSAHFIAVPETDAYAATPRVLAEIEKARGYDDIFLSAGPAASVWAHQLAGRHDGRVLDVGSFNTQLRYLA